MTHSQTVADKIPNNEYCVGMAAQVTLQPLKTNRKKL